MIACKFYFALDDSSDFLKLPGYRMTTLGWARSACQSLI